MPICKNCGEEKDSSDFVALRKKDRDLCCVCLWARRRRFRTKEQRMQDGVIPGVYGKSRPTKASLEKFGLSYNQYKNILRKQNGVCAICGEPEPGHKRLSIDHDHTTNKVRGLLCSKCNPAIGLFKDDPELCISAANYLKEHK